MVEEAPGYFRWNFVDCSLRYHCSAGGWLAGEDGETLANEPKHYLSTVPRLFGARRVGGPIPEETSSTVHHRH